jgi:protein TonB
MFETALALSQSAPKSRRATLLVTALVAHVALGTGVVVANTWQLSPVEPPALMEVFVDVSFTPPDEPIPVAPKVTPPKAESAPAAHAVEPTPAPSTPQAVQPISADIPIPGPDANLPEPGHSSGGPVILENGSGNGGDGTDVGGDPWVAVPVGAGITPPIVLSRVQPNYPKAAMVARRQGRVIVEAEIDPTGALRGVRLLSTPLGFGLDQAAIDAVRAWRFSPARRGDRPVAVYFRLTVNFNLR